jgi:hypothetical protein
MRPHNRVAPATASQGRSPWLRLALAAGSVILASMPEGAAAGQAPARPAADAPASQSSTSTIDIEVADTTVSAVVAILRTRQCAAVSFIPAPGDQRLSVALRAATVEGVLRELAARRPAYRYEKISGHDVLYPVSPEFQTVLRGVGIKKVPRFEATYQYLPVLKAAVPALARLAGPSMFGTLTLPFFTAPVSVRASGRVIEQLIDLLGPDPRMYLSFGTAVTGVPTLDLDDVKCQPVVRRVQLVSCFDGSAPDAAEDVLARRISITAADQPLAAIVERLRAAEHLPLSFIEDAAVGRVSAEFHDVPARWALQVLLARIRNYQCLVGNGRVVIASNDPAYRATLHAFPDTRLPPWTTMHLYYGRLGEAIPAFRDLKVPWDPTVDPRLRSDEHEVTLSPDATVLEHLVQLLGDIPEAFFTIRRLPSGGRELSLGAVR